MTDISLKKLKPGELFYFMRVNSRDTNLKLNPSHNVHSFINFKNLALCLKIVIILEVSVKINGGVFKPSYPTISKSLVPNSY